MIFTTTKKKQEKVELFPDMAVLTQFPYVKDSKFSKTVFKLNPKAMEAFGFTMNTPNVNKIANGFDEHNNIVLAALDTNDIYTSNVTAKNTFSSQKLMERIASELGIDMAEQHHFELKVAEYDGVKVSYLELLDTNAKEEEETSEEVFDVVTLAEAHLVTNSPMAEDAEVSESPFVEVEIPNANPFQQRIIRPDNLF